jgi:hypothetical protein
MLPNYSCKVNCIYAILNTSGCSQRSSILRFKLYLFDSKEKKLNGKCDV